MKARILVIAYAQVWLFVISMIGFIGLIYILLLGYAKLDDSSEKLAYTMLGVLGTIVTQQAGYFYSRQRNDEGNIHEAISDLPTTTRQTTTTIKSTGSVPPIPAPIVPPGDNK